MTSRKTIVVAAALAAGVLAAGASAVGILRYGSPTGQKYGDWAPGNSGSVGALSRLPAQAKVPADVLSTVRSMASATGGNEAVAVASLRLLRSNLGVTHSDFYAFRPSAGNAVCSFVTGRGGVCPTAASSTTAGIEWAIGGGYPAWSEHGYVPPSIDGIASDNIRSVTLSSNGVEIPLEIVNNAFYKDLDMPPDGTPWSLQIRIVYANGAEKREAIPDPRSD
jgi:hypothetical protein